MPCSRRDHSQCAPRRHVDHLDRARPSCAERGSRTPASAEFRQGDRHRRAAGNYGLPRGPRNLSGDRNLMALLETRALTATYGDFQALFGVDMTLDAGETVAVV